MSVLTKQPVIISQSQHNITHAKIGKNACKVLTKLEAAGFAAYLVGGGVRDLLLGLHPKDFDVVTDARPEQIRKLFHNCILIGRRFRLAHVRFGRETIEVATFRGEAKHSSAKHRCSKHGMLLRDNYYGSIEEDVWRRDFTVNALYYRVSDSVVIDYIGGMQDLRKKTIRIIGEPEERYREDPVRMLRAIRLAAKLNFTIATSTAKPFKQLGGLIKNIAAARLFDEVAKWFRSGSSLAVFALLCKYKFFAILFAPVAKSLQNNKKVAAMLRYGFANTDKRLKENKTINPAFLYAVLLWWPLQEQIKLLRTSNNMSEFAALRQAIEDILQQQKVRIMLPRILIFTIKDIWKMQYQLAQKKKRIIYYVLGHPKFRAAYDFLLLRAQAGERVKALAQWWTLIQEVDEQECDEMIEAR